MKKTICGIVFSSLLTIGSASATDLYNNGDPGYCRIIKPSQVLDLEMDKMRSEIEFRFEHSVDVANSEQWVNSSRPVYTWASETKVACGKAIGYLKRGHVEEDYVNKCDCFYDRMRWFMN